MAAPLPQAVAGQIGQAIPPLLEVRPVADIFCSVARRNRLGPLAALLAGAVLVAPGALAATARGERPRPSAARASDSALLTGVTVAGGGGPAEERRELSAAAALGAQVVRTEVRWAALEPHRGSFNGAALAQLDQFMAIAQRLHLRVIAMIDGTPCWDSAAPRRLRLRCRAGVETAANAWPPIHDRPFSRFVAFVAKRYAADLAAVEIWNEPDQANEAYLAGPDKAAHYAALLKAGYRGVKSVAPRLPVLGGAIVGGNGRFLASLYAEGIKGFLNGLSVHFYTLTIAALRNTRAVELRYGDPAPIWLDEFGWPSCWPQRKVEAEQPCVTEKVQAENLEALIHELARLPYVHAAVFYKLTDSPGQAFGVLRENGVPKPSFAGVRRAFADPGAPVRPIALRLRRRGRRLVATGSGPVGDYFVLEASLRGRLRYRAVFTLNRFNRYRVPLPAALGTTDLLVRVRQYQPGLTKPAERLG